jgi:hypothetical protein
MTKGFITFEADENGGTSRKTSEKLEEKDLYFCNCYTKDLREFETFLKV